MSTLSMAAIRPPFFGGLPWFFRSPTVFCSSIFSGSGLCHFLCVSDVLFSPVGFKGSLSLLNILLFFKGAEANGGFAKRILQQLTRILVTSSNQILVDLTELSFFSFRESVFLSWGWNNNRTARSVCG